MQSAPNDADFGCPGSALKHINYADVIDSCSRQGSGLGLHSDRVVYHKRTLNSDMVALPHVAHSTHRSA